MKNSQENTTTGVVNGGSAKIKKQKGKINLKGHMEPLVFLVMSVVLFIISMLFIASCTIPSSLEKACEGQPDSNTGLKIDEISTLPSEVFILNTEELENGLIKVVPADPTFQPITSGSESIEASSCPTSPQYVGDRYEFSYVDANGKEGSVTVAKELVDIKLLNEGETPMVEAVTTVFENKERYGETFKQHKGDESKVEFTRYFVRL